MYSFLYTLLFFLYIKPSFQLDSITPDLIDTYKKVYANSQYQSKLISCLNLVQLSLKHKNKNLEEGISRTSQNRTQYFYKYTMAMLVSCMKQITDEHIDQILTQDITAFDEFSIGIQHLVDISNNFDKLEFTQEEYDVYNEITRVVDRKRKTKENVVNDSFIRKNMKKFIIIAVCILLFSLYNTVRASKIKKTKTEEELEKEEKEKEKQSKLNKDEVNKKNN